MKTSLLHHISLLLLILSLLVPSFAMAIEIAPRISDREIIQQSLVDLKQGMKDMLQRFGSIDRGFENNDRSFERINQRFTELNSRINTWFTVLLGLILVLFGYITWSRIILMKAFQEKKRDSSPKLASVLRSFSL